MFCYIVLTILRFFFVAASLLFAHSLGLPSLHFVRVELHNLFFQLCLHPRMKSVLHVLLTALQRSEQHFPFLAFRRRIENLLSYHWINNRSICDEPSDRSTHFLIA
jgi:hypothetical protein